MEGLTWLSLPLKKDSKPGQLNSNAFASRSRRRIKSDHDRSIRYSFPVSFNSRPAFASIYGGSEAATRISPQYETKNVTL